MSFQPVRFIVYQQINHLFNLCMHDSTQRATYTILFTLHAYKQWELDMMRSDNKIPKPDLKNKKKSVVPMILISLFYIVH